MIASPTDNNGSLRNQRFAGLLATHRCRCTRRSCRRGTSGFILTRIPGRRYVALRFHERLCRVKVQHRRICAQNMHDYAEVVASDEILSPSAKIVLVQSRFVLRVEISCN